jgi:hypothetical protein
MEPSDAIRTVQEYAELHTQGDILAALKDMQACWDDLDKQDRVAYNMFIKAIKNLFAPID